MIKRIKKSFAEKHHANKWRDDHDRYMSMVIAFFKAGYSWDQSHRMAEQHRLGDSILATHNGGPPID